MARDRRRASAVARGLGAVLLTSTLVMGLGCRGRAQRPPVADVERTWVPLGPMPLRGPATAKVTVVIFADFQSPYCARAEERLFQVKRGYGDDLRVQFRHRPLPNDPDAQGAAEAAASADEQGQFWKYHDVLFAHQDALDRASLERYARDAGLDLDRFRYTIDSGEARKRVDADSILAAELGARGAPVMFINGRAVRGLPEVATLKQIIDEEIAAADSLLTSGVPPREIYKRLAQSTPDHLPAASPPAPVAPADVDPQAVYKVDVGDSPGRGPKDAKVTIVVWSDFECAPCAQSEPLISAAAAAHTGDVRIVWKGRPVADHDGARLAVEAAIAAGKEGKFWPMHDLLFTGQGLERAKLEAYAGKVGLDMPSFRRALDERTYAGLVADDLDLAERLAVKTLPTLFINGRPLGREALSSAGLEGRIAEEISRADTLVAQGVPRERIYATITSRGLEGVPGPRLSDLPPLPKGVYPVDLGSSPSLGPAEAPITIVTFSDFECPYCARLTRTLARLRQRYGDRLRIVWKDAPLPEHARAMGAHEAGRAAREQGRFWEMHDKIFGHPFNLDRPAFERYAREIGLDMSRFESALDQGKFRDAIREEASYGISLAGPSGTPTVFVNGRLLPGAYPFDAFCEIIDAELARRLPPTPVAQPAPQAR